MKKFLLVLALFACVLTIGSCVKSEDKTTYTVIIDFTDSHPELGVKQDLTLIEYSAEGDRTAQYVFPEISTGEYKVYKSVRKSTHIKIMVKIYNSENSLTMWVQQVYKLKKNKNLNIVFSNDTKLAPTEPEG